MPEENQPHVSAPATTRPRIAFFDYPDVFEDFYSHYGVSQRAFATTWADTANHAWVELVQREIGDVIWYVPCLTPEAADARHEKVGCEVKFLSSAWLHRALWKLFYLPKCAWRWRGLYRPYATVASYLAPLSLALFSALRRDRPDAIFVQSYASGKFDVLLLMARALGIPFLALHSGEVAGRSLGNTAKRWTMPAADWLFPSGQGELEKLSTRYRVARERMSIIRPPVNMGVFQPMDRAAACAAHRLDPQRRYVLFCGRLEDQVKRVNAIIRAFAKATATHGDAGLLILGDGADRKDLESVAREVAPDRVHFLGWISEPIRKAELYSLAECLVLASWREASPAVISESLACGTPVTASRVGAIGDLVIPGETGWLFEPGDDEALAASLAAVFESRERIAAMRLACRRMAEEHVSPEAVTAGLREGFVRVGLARE